MSSRLVLVMLATGLLCAPALPQAAQQDIADGFIVYTPLNGTDTYLLDESGTIVHTWSSSFIPGNSVYLLPNGNLLRTKRVTGIGNGVQEIAWDGTVVWDFTYDGPTAIAQHDVTPLPNGNVLMVAWDLLTPATAIAAGMNPAFIQGSTFAADHVIEVQPSGPTSGTIVWAWRAMDHVVQDFDPTQANFGVVADAPQLLDINYPPEANSSWLQIDSIDFNPALDQVLLSLRNQSEIVIIDHSTTTAQAAGHSGGNSGQGGDLLYRWGNPFSYGAGTVADQQLFEQHDATWIDPGLPGAGNILVFNNNYSAPPMSASAVFELVPPVDAFGNYTLVPGSSYGPTAPVWIYTAPIPTDLYSPLYSGCERQPNGNTLVCSGVQGWFFEVTPGKQKVWEYFNVLPSVPEKIVFKGRRYQHYLWSQPQTLSVAAGGVINMPIEATVERAGDLYWLLGSVSGSQPGVPIAGQVLPLNLPDPYFDLTLSSPNLPPLLNTFGNLDAQGSANAQFVLGAGVAPALLIGFQFDHAYVVFDGTPTPVVSLISLASNAASFTLVP